MKPTLSFQVTHTGSKDALQLSDSRSDPAEANGSWEHPVYSVYGFRQMMSWAAVDSFQRNGWKVAKHYGVTTADLAVGTPYSSWKCDGQCLTRAISCCT